MQQKCLQNMSLILNTFLHFCNICKHICKHFFVLSHCYIRLFCKCLQCYSFFQTFWVIKCLKTFKTSI